MPRPIAIANAHPRLRFSRPALTRVIATLDAAGGRFQGGPPAGELSIALLTDAALAALHGRFLDDPTHTDVITFAGEPAFGTAGEICVSADTAAIYAAKHGRNFSTELTLYVVHGWLHLAGYDDLEPVKKRRMRAAEKRAMTLLADAGLDPAFRLRA